MKLTKAERITKTKAEFDRGYIEIDDNSDFAKLYISAIKEFLENDTAGTHYCYWNWSLFSLKDLADAIYAFLEEIEKNKKPTN